MESPTSNVSSPGPKPVNFDLQRTTQAIVSDPQILHPVPLRVTPVGKNENSSEKGIKGGDEFVSSLRSRRSRFQVLKRSTAAV